MNDAPMNDDETNDARTTLVVVRHGETAWSLSGQHTGRTDVPLTAAGEASAAQLGARLAVFRPSLVISSPLSRSLDTARLAGFGDRLEIDDDLAEWDYGDYEGRTSAEINVGVPGWTVWTGAIPNGETIADVAARADRVIARALPVGGTVMLFAHGHISRILAARWVDHDPHLGRRLALNTARFGHLAYEHEDRVIADWNR
jgi:broad specificity phosphatase PhoE